MNTATPLVTSSAWSTKRTAVSWWYPAIADLMLANPEMTKGEIAARLKCAGSTLAIITNSDSFVAYYNRRRAEFEANFDTAIKRRLLRVADKTLGLVEEKLDQKRTALELSELSELASDVLGKLGYGEKGSAPVTVNLNQDNRTQTMSVSAADLHNARANLRQRELDRIGARDGAQVEILPPSPQARVEETKD